MEEAVSPSTIDFRDRQHAESIRLSKIVTQARIVADGAEESRKWFASAMSNGERYQPTIRRVKWEGNAAQWYVEIPPFNVSHFEGGHVDGSILAPFGTTEWDSIQDATEYLEHVLADIAEGKYDLPEAES